MKNILVGFLMVFVGQVFGQATFVITSLPQETPPDDPIYMASNLNGWNPGSPDHLLTRNDDGLYEITTEAFPEGIAIEFKFTRGSWATVEKGPNMEELPNRTFTFGNGDTVDIIIYNWADLGSAESTATWNVSVMADSFYMPQLDRYRRIWLYLPPDYDSTPKRYPVIYMHDGQNLFDELTSFSGEWEVDETLNELYTEGYQVPIVVGIDHGGEYRMDELTPWEFSLGGGQGGLYLEFIVEILKPHIDAHYRTLSGREHTGIIGSSLGGLISAYGALRYQEVFSKSGPMSPAYWVNHDSLFDYVSRMDKKQDIRFYQSIGTDEGSNNILLMHDFEDSLRMTGFNEILSVEIEGAGHNEITWRDDFANAYLWLFDQYASDIPESREKIEVPVFPNPAGDYVVLQDVVFSKTVRMNLFDVNGRFVRLFSADSSRLDISGLPVGYYTLMFFAEGRVHIARFVKQ
ncbi:MAG: alpha/beta hydrolase-fold protein [bacterium]